MESRRALIHPLAMRDEPTMFPASFRPVAGPWPFAVVRTSGPDDLLLAAAEGLPEGAARAEALAVRLRRSGVAVGVGAPVVLSPRAALKLSRERGRSSVAMLRADPGLLTELQAGAWFQAGWRTRALRRLSRGAPASLLAAAPMPTALRAGLDLAFWSGVRAAATPQEWRRLARSSYVAFCYHRIAGAMAPGQERLDLSPRAFRMQMRLLRLLGYRPLDPDALARFHHDPTAALPRRRYVLTADDGYDDSAREFAEQARHRPQLYVPTAMVGGAPPWAPDASLADWELLRELAAAGVAVGAHSRTHPSLTALSDGALARELDGALGDLRRHLDPVEACAYPHGHHDLRVRAAAIRAGYRLAWTTDVGRNGAGTDPWCLRRVGVKAHDGLVSFLWKAVTGELPPPAWERRRLARAARGALR